MSSGARTMQQERLVIPRWRPSRSSGLDREVAVPGATRALSELAISSFNERLADFGAAPGSWTGADLLSAAVTLDVFADVHATAERVVEGRFGETPGLSHLAHTILERHREAESLDLHFQEISPEDVLRQRKSALRRDPRNALAWLDAGLAYTILGQRDLAHRAVDIALALAPDNRLVVRSGARFYLHVNDPERAHEVITRSLGWDEDPWRTSTAISTSIISGRSPEGMRRARALLAESGPSGTELASSIATAELIAGKDRAALKGFRLSLQQPTENVLAQAEWASHTELPSLETREELALAVRERYEAEARHHLAQGNALEALDQSKKWIEYQPFSSEAAAFASYVASVAIGDFHEAARIAEAGLRSNPVDPYLLNNAAFAHLLLDEPQRARQLLEQIESGSLSKDSVHLATTGLLAYKEGDIQGGRAAYEAAVAKARTQRNADTVALISLFWAIAEAQAGQGRIDTIRASAEQLAKEGRSPSVAKWLEELRKMWPVQGHDNDPDRG